MATTLDLQQLAVDRSGTEAPKRRPPRHVLTRYVLPLAVVLGFASLLGPRPRGTGCTPSPSTRPESPFLPGEAGRAAASRTTSWTCTIRRERTDTLSASPAPPGITSGTGTDSSYCDSARIRRS